MCTRQTRERGRPATASCHLPCTCSSLSLGFYASTMAPRSDVEYLLSWAGRNQAAMLGAGAERRPCPLLTSLIGNVGAPARQLTPT
eukprot:scaffold286749_cov33-Tisochrysis_lutea.AAC.1